MTITLDMCSRFTADVGDFASYVASAISIEGVGLVGSEADDAIPRTLQFEVVHTDATCRLDLADACVFLSAVDRGLRFVAPATDVAANYVSYWHQEIAEPDGTDVWASLAPGQPSSSADIAILGQTLPQELDPARGSGYLHYVQDARPGDGWTVRVGVTPSDIGTLHGLALEVRVAARPDWCRSTDGQTVQIP